MRICEEQGWTFTKGKSYYKGRCPCGYHSKTVHLTPNNSYLQNFKHYFRRLECWDKEVTL